MDYQVSNSWSSGYDDHDDYVVTYNTETGKLSRYLLFTTRFPSDNFKDPPPKADETVMKLAKRALVSQYIIPEMVNNYINPRIEKAYANRHYAISIGDKLTLKKKATTSHRQLCKKCNHTGKWTNPKNPKDIRDCFTCEGMGITNYIERVNGKPVKVSVDKGSVGTVMHLHIEYDKYNRGESFNKYFVFMKFDGIDKPVKVNENALIRECADEAELIAKLMPRAEDYDGRFIHYLM